MIWNARPVEAEPHEQHLERGFFFSITEFWSSDEVWFLLWWLILCKRLLIIIHCNVLLVSEINCLQSTRAELYPASVCWKSEMELHFAKCKKNPKWNGISFSVHQSVPWFIRQLRPVVTMCSAGKHVSTNWVIEIPRNRIGIIQILEVNYMWRFMRF